MSALQFTSVTKAAQEQRRAQQRTAAVAAAQDQISRIYPSLLTSTTATQQQQQQSPHSNNQLLASRGGGLQPGYYYSVGDINPTLTSAPIPCTAPASNGNAMATTGGSSSPSAAPMTIAAVATFGSPPKTTGAFTPTAAHGDRQGLTASPSSPPRSQQQLPSAVPFGTLHHPTATSTGVAHTSTPSPVAAANTAAEYQQLLRRELSPNQPQQQQHFYEGIGGGGGPQFLSPTPTPSSSSVSHLKPVTASSTLKPSFSSPVAAAAGQPTSSVMRMLATTSSTSPLIASSTSLSKEANITAAAMGHLRLREGDPTSMTTTTAAHSGTSPAAAKGHTKSGITVTPAPSDIGGGGAAVNQQPTAGSGDHPKPTILSTTQQQKDESEHGTTTNDGSSHALHDRLVAAHVSGQGVHHHKLSQEQIACSPFAKHAVPARLRRETLAANRHHPDKEAIAAKISEAFLCNKTEQEIHEEEFQQRTAMFFHNLKEAAERETQFMSRCEEQKVIQQRDKVVNQGKNSPLEKKVQVGLANTVLMKHQAAVATDMALDLVYGGHMKAVDELGPSTTYNSANPASQNHPNVEVATGANHLHHHARSFVVDGPHRSMAAQRIHEEEKQRREKNRIKGAAKGALSPYSKTGKKFSLRHEDFVGMGPLYSVALTEEEKHTLLCTLKYGCSKEFIQDDFTYRQTIGWFRADVVKLLMQLSSTFLQWHCLCYNQGHAWNIIHNVCVEVRKPISWGSKHSTRSTYFGHVSIRKVEVLHDKLLKDMAHQTRPSGPGGVVGLHPSSQLMPTVEEGGIAPM